MLDVILDLRFLFQLEFIKHIWKDGVENSSKRENLQTWTLISEKLSHTLKVTLL